MAAAVSDTQFQVLVVNGEPVRTSTHQRYLENEGLKVLTTANAEDVLKFLETDTPDLIIIDLDVGGEAAFTVCRQLKTNPVTVLLPIIALSRTVRHRLDAFAAGVDEFMTRQTRREEFIARVHALVRLGSLRRTLAIQLAAEVKRQEQMRQTFRRYLSPTLADRILSDSELRDSLLTQRNVRMRASVMFADMRGFTSISERLRPADVVPLLNEYFSLLTDITFQHEGTVFHMAGDCLMVGFGVPVEQDDGSERAFKTAEEMLIRFRSLADEWKRRHDIDTGLGIGINEGDVIAGNVGSPAYMNYTIVGDTVNIASRLSQRARSGEMLFSDSIKKSLESRGYVVPANTMALPPLVLRGRSSTVDIYCIPTEEDRPEFRH